MKTLPDGSKNKKTRCPFTKQTPQEYGAKMREWQRRKNDAELTALLEAYEAVLAILTADRIPAPSLVETARREAIETARRTVEERSETARRLEEKYKSLEAYAQSFETSPAYNEETAADLKKETRRALDLAREARAARWEAVEEYQMKREWLRRKNNAKLTALLEAYEAVSAILKED